MTKLSYSTAGSTAEGAMFPERQSIIAFLEWLRDGRSGFEASDQQYMAAYDLIQVILKSNEEKIPPVTAWSKLLAPILSSSQIQQSEFYDLFDKWFLTRETLVSPPIERSGDSQRRLNLDVWLYGLAALTVAVILGWVIYRHLSSPPANSRVVPFVRPSPNKQVPPPANVSVLIEYGNSPVSGAEIRYSGQRATSKEGYVELPRSASAAYLQVTADGFRPVIIPFPKDNAVVALTRPVPITLQEAYRGLLSIYGFRMRLALMVLPALLLLGWLIQRWRRALELRRWASSVEPRMRRLSSSWMAKPLFSESDIRKLATAMRRRRSEASPELDVSQTVEMTCREYGWFTPIYAKRSSEPEYLFLGERKNLRDHQTRLQDELLGCLRNHDVFVQRYYFQSDPTVCSDLKGNVYSLKELAVLCPSHEMWLGLDSDACFDPASGELMSWLVPLEQWRDRALLSFNVPRVDIGMRVATPTRRGIEGLAGDRPKPFAERPYPSLLRDTVERWVQRIEPPEANTPMLELQLQRYLGEEGFVLLQACAVYPALAWNITLALASELLPSGQREDILWKLSALPWFRHGTMPNWLRVRLLSRLGSNETRARAALRKFLDQTVVRAEEKQEALDIVPGKPELSAGRLALQDHVFLFFASGRRLDQLSVEAPPRWRRFLRESVSLRIGFALLSMLMIWLVLGKLQREVDHRIRFRPGQIVDVDSPKDAFTAELFTVAQSFDPAPPGKTPGRSRTPDLLLYSNIASDVLNIVNPFPDTDHVFQMAKPVASNFAAPGVAVNVGGRLQMVEAVANGKIWLFQSTSWTNQGEAGTVYDVSNAPLVSPKRSRQENSDKDTASATIASTPATSDATLKSDNPTSGEIQPPTIPGVISGGNGKPIPIKVSVDSASLYIKSEEELSGGPGEFRFGMSPTEVNEKLGMPFGNVDSLPIAGEYAPSEVHYFWVRLSVIDSADFDKFLSLLKPFESCMQNGSQSYISFDFVDNKLIRIVSRFFDDCAERDESFQNFIRGLGLRLNQPSQSESLELNIGSTNITWYLGSGGNPDSLEIWTQGSPVPNINILNPAPAVPGSASPVASGVTPANSPSLGPNHPVKPPKSVSRIAPNPSGQTRSNLAPTFPKK